MRLSDHDLLQLTEKELLELPEDVLRQLSIKLLYDLKEAREPLKQTSKNSSRPPSSDLPWNIVDTDDVDTHDPQRSDESTGSDEELKTRPVTIEPDKTAIHFNLLIFTRSTCSKKSCACFIRLQTYPKKLKNNLNLPCTQQK